MQDYLKSYWYYLKKNNTQRVDLVEQCTRANSGGESIKGFRFLPVY